MSAFDVPLMVQFRVHLIIQYNLGAPGIAPKVAVQDLYKGAQKGASEMALKDAFQAALELLLFMQLSMHVSVQYDLVKGKIEMVLYCYASRYI